jgi:hypothetical protein
MPHGDAFILLGLGGGFILLGLIGLFFGFREETGYFNRKARSDDLREFMNHWPPRPQLGALKIGGWIALAVGVVLLIVGIVLRITG